MAKVAVSSSTTVLDGNEDVDLKALKKQAQRDVLVEPEVEERAEEINGQPVKQEKTFRQVITSPFERGDRNGMLRKRTRFHQTWINDVDVDYYKEVGYFLIRKAKEGEKAGQESGEIIKRNEGKDRYQYAMEVSLDLYEQHMAAVVAKSHAAYTSQSDVLRESVENTNRDLGSRMEVIEEREDYAEQMERIEKRR